jgi:Zn-dependent M28 family amino/carboxypeptidase
MSAQTSRLYDDVRFLTELRPFRNYRNLDSLARAASYIRNVMRDAGLEVSDQHWIADDLEYTNVIGVYNPGKPRTLVVGAHYDVYDEQPGADDNASGVAGLLEVARLLGEHRPELEYTVELVGYCLEEVPFFWTDAMGSFIHARSLLDRQADVIGLICLDMIGYFSDEPGSQQTDLEKLDTQFPDRADFIMVIGAVRDDSFLQQVSEQMAAGGRIHVHTVPVPWDDATRTLATQSDTFSFWCFDYPSVLVNDTAFLRTRRYHTSEDTIDTLDFEKMSNVVNGVYWAVVGMG